MTQLFLISLRGLLWLLPFLLAHSFLNDSITCFQNFSFATQLSQIIQYVFLPPRGEYIFWRIKAITQDFYPSPPLLINLYRAFHGRHSIVIRWENDLHHLVLNYCVLQTDICLMSMGSWRGPWAGGGGGSMWAGSSFPFNWMFGILGICLLWGGHLAWTIELNDTLISYFGNFVYNSSVKYLSSSFLYPISIQNQLFKRVFQWLLF